MVRTILVSFTAAHRQLHPDQVDVLHPQAQQLHEPQSRAICQLCHEPGGALQLGEQPAALVRSEHDRYALPGRGPLEIKLAQLPV